MLHFQESFYPLQVLETVLWLGPFLRPPRACVHDGMHRVLWRWPVRAHQSRGQLCCGGSFRCSRCLYMFQVSLTLYVLAISEVTWQARVWSLLIQQEEERAREGKGERERKTDIFLSWHMWHLVLSSLHPPAKLWALWRSRASLLQRPPAPQCLARTSYTVGTQMLTSKWMNKKFLPLYLLCESA